MEDVVEPLGGLELEEIILLDPSRSQGEERTDGRPARHQHLRLKAWDDGARGSRDEAMQGSRSTLGPGIPVLMPPGNS